MSNINVEEEVKKPFLPLSNQFYSKLKFVALILLPALSTLYFTLGTIWGLPAVERIIGTLAAISTFLGVLLGLSSKAYNSSEARFAGHIVITEKPGQTKLYSLEMNGHPSTLDTMKEATFKIGPKT